MGVFLAIVAILVVAFSAGMFVIRNLIYICGPNEVLVFSGSHSIDAQGKRRGYRIIKGGRGIRIPMLERVSRMDLTNMIIDLEVSEAYSKGGIPLTVEAVANMKIAGEEPVIHNAIERLLGKHRAMIMRIAKETLEGNLRGVLATLTPEEVNEDKIAFSQSLLEESSDDLALLGLSLDTLQVQNISDNVKYLDSIGRKQSAELIRDSRIAEAIAKTESIVRAAENGRDTAFAQIISETEKVKAEAQRRIVDATTKRSAMVAEVEAEVGAKLVRTEAELGVQKARLVAVERRLEADVIAPAEANAQRMEEQAKADAALVTEEGKALVEGLNALIESWRAAGDSAHQIFMMQKLELLLGTLVASVKDIKLDRLTIIDTRNGSNSALNTASFLEQLKQAAGLDVPAVVKAFAATKGNGGGEGPAA
jgi:flotillin